jgi:hypothetical protein
MPLTKSGKKIKRTFELRYGKTKGTVIFYSSMNKNPDKTKKWHGKNDKKNI